MSVLQISGQLGLKVIDPFVISGQYFRKLNIDKQLIEKCDPFSETQIFIDMSKKTKHLTIRLSEEQFRKLADTLVIEQKSKSLLMREILEDYLDRNKSRIEWKNQKNNVKLKSST
jgi:hypothetical protein